jgi:hypothetical protein
MLYESEGHERVLQLNVHILVISIDLQLQLQRAIQ